MPHSQSFYCHCCLWFYVFRIFDSLRRISSLKYLAAQLNFLLLTLANEKTVPQKLIFKEVKEKP